MRYASIRSMDISNGECIGVALFLQGCHFHCKGCFNTETWDYTGGHEWDAEVEMLLIDYMRDSFISRISILGGEPLSECNLKELHNFLLKVKRIYPDKKIWLYTGYTFDEAVLVRDRKKIISLCDVLVDGLYEEDKKDFTLMYRGSSNQRLIDVHKTLKQGEVVLWEI